MGLLHNGRLEGDKVSGSKTFVKFEITNLWGVFVLMRCFGCLILLWVLKGWFPRKIMSFVVACVEVS